jgi:hypothetical protein
MALGFAKLPPREDADACWRLHSWTDGQRDELGRLAAEPASILATTAQDASTVEVRDVAKRSKKHHAEASATSREPEADPPAKLKRKDYERELRRLHGELVAM